MDKGFHVEVIQNILKLTVVAVVQLFDYKKILKFKIKLSFKMGEFCMLYKLYLTEVLVKICLQCVTLNTIVETNTLTKNICAPALNIEVNIFSQ